MTSMATYLLSVGVVMLDTSWLLRISCYYVDYAKEAHYTMI